MLLVIILVLAITIVSSFITGIPGVNGVFSVDNYLRVFRSPAAYQAMVNSMLFALGTVLVNLFFAVPMAWLVQRTDLPFKKTITTLMYVAVTIPSFLVVMAWVILLSPRVGLLNQALRTFIPVAQGPIDPYNLVGMAFVEGLALTPLMFLMISAAIRAVDPQLEESGETVGLGRLGVLRYIAAPVVMPAILAAALYNFMTAMSSFEVPALIGRPGQVTTLSINLFYAVQTSTGLPQYGIAAVYGLLMLLPALIGLYFYMGLLRRAHRYQVVTGKGYRPSLIRLGRAKYLGLGFVSFFFLLKIVLPMVVLLWVSLTPPAIRMPTWDALSWISLDGYQSALRAATGQSLRNTVVLMVATTVVVLVFSTLISWLVIRSKVRGRHVLDAVALLPHAIPGLAIAFAVALVGLALARVVPLYGRIEIIVLALAISTIGFGTRTLNSTLVQIHPDLEDAVTTCGGSRLVALTRVLIPLITPALVYAALWIALLAMRNVSIPLFLMRRDNVVLAAQIWNLWQDAGSSVATVAALGVMMVTVSVILVTAALTLASRYLHGFKSSL
jgi:iron(III) transport system permease protein